MTTPLYRDIREWGTIGQGGDDSAVVQQSINDMYNTPSIGGTVRWPPGQFYVHSLAMKGAVNWIGSGRETTALIIPAGLNGTVLLFDDTCHQAGIQRMSIHGYNNGDAAHPTVQIAENRRTLLRDVNIHFGSTGLLTYGVDGYFDNCDITGWHYSCVQFGASWFKRIRFNNAGYPEGHGIAGFAHGHSFFGPNAGGENHMEQCDLSGNWQYSFVLNDVYHKATMSLTGCVFGGPVRTFNGKLFNAVNCYMPSLHNDDPYCTVSLTGCWGNNSPLTGPNITRTGGGGFSI